MSSRPADEYLVCVPKPGVKKYNVMRFNTGDKEDIKKWVSGSLSRDVSAKKIYEEEEVYPEFGEGSEYGRKQKEEARRLKYGIKHRKFNVENQPWNLSVTSVDTQTDAKKRPNGKSDIKPNLVTKHYSGRKEGGIGEGSMYFIFTQNQDYTFEAHPVSDWYNFKRKIKHRTLTDEEAEAAWDKRDKIVNHLNYMARKRLHINEEEEGEEEDAAKSDSKKGIKKVKDNSLVIHDNEDYELYMSGSSSDDDGSDNETKKKKKAKKTKPEESEEDVEEAVEDSDDGEHEGTELAYASDISSENEEVNDSKVVPRGLDELSSSSSSEDEEQDKEKIKEIIPENKRSFKQSRGSDESASSGDSGSDIDDEDSLSKSALFMQRKKTPPKDKKGRNAGSGSNSRSSTPTSELSGTSVRTKLHDVSKKLEDQSSRRSPLTIGSKRTATNSGDVLSSKRQKFSHPGSGNSTPTKELSQSGITEEAVRRYLTLKPITTKDLLKKFKTKKTGLSSKQIVETVAKILKKLNPEQIKISDKMHLYLKAV